MTAPVNFPIRDELLEDYLLGRLSDDETERLDELSIVDDDFVWRLRDVENDLVDAYVRGDLGAETRLHFEASYLDSPTRRDKVAFARRFVRAIERAGDPGARSASAPAPAARWGSRRVLWLSAAAAAVVVAVGGGLFVRQALVRPDQAPAGVRAAVEPASAGALPPSTTSSRPAGASPVEASPIAPAPAVTSAAETPLVLMPETRGAASIAALQMPAGADRARVELRLEANDFPQYQAVLTDPSTGRVVWRSDWLAAVPSGGLPTIAVAVPVRLLTPQHWTVEVVGRRGGGGRTDVVGSYVFQVASR